MFPLLGLLITGTLGAVCLSCLLAATRAAAAKRDKAAQVWTIPIALIGGFFVLGILWGSYAAEAHPEKIFAQIFGIQPAPQVTQLRAYSDDDELNPVFLQFQAPPALARKLLNSRFRPVSSGSSAIALSDAKRLMVPQWFATEVTTSAQIFQWDDGSHNSPHFAIYDSKLNRVRIYLDNPAPLHGQ